MIVTGRSAARLRETIAERSHMAAYHLESADAAAVETFTQRVTTEHPRLNVLFNNAGIMRREDVTIERDLSDAEETIKVNLLGPIRRLALARTLSKVSLKSRQIVDT